MTQTRFIPMTLRNTLLVLLMLVGSLLSPLEAFSGVAGNGGLAVVIIDMQKGFYERGGVTNTQGLKDLVVHQRLLLKWAVAKKIPVLFFEYTGFGATDPRLINPLRNHPHAVVVKHEDNGFASPSKAEAMAILKKWRVDTLVVAGINGGFCVKATVMGAIKSGFDVISSSDIVGNINQNPPLYPNGSWIFGDNKLVIFEDIYGIVR